MWFSELVGPLTVLFDFAIHLPTLNPGFTDHSDYRLKMAARLKSSSLPITLAVCAIGISGFIGRWIAEMPLDQVPAHSNHLRAERTLIHTTPHSSLTPSQVVAYQLKAIQKANHSKSAFEECYAFATPSNRTFVGTTEQFEKMVRTNYSSLIGFQTSVIGRESIDGGLAHVMVTGIDANDQFMCFQFVLVKQTESPFADCWMTEGVIRIDQPEKVKDSLKRQINLSIDKVDINRPLSFAIQGSLNL